MVNFLKPHLYNNLVAGLTAVAFTTFLKIDWLIDGWGGPDDVVDALKKCKERHLEKLEEYRVKYAVELKKAME